LAYLLWMIKWVKFASFAAGNNTQFRTEGARKPKNFCPHAQSSKVL